MVLRDAMKRLALEELVVSEPYKGSFVAEISIDNAYEAYQLQSFLEGSAAFLAAIHIPAKEVEKLESLIDESKRVDPHDGEKWEQYNREIHKTINDRCGNRKLQKAIRDNLKLVSYWFIILSTPTAEEVSKRNNEHEVILNAIKEGNPSKVRECMERHIMGAAEDLKQRLQRTFPVLT
jgi:DNA-binding GntR family transcriptional regulator